MARNVEIKAKVDDFEALRERVESLCGGSGEEIAQEDIFFNTGIGRLKLRILGPERGQLIFYERVNEAGPTLSEYLISETADPEGLRAIIRKVAGIRGTVRKRRWLYWFGSTRIHLDQVDGLGSFVELEVVLDPGEKQESGRAIAAEVMEQLDINPADLIEGAYIDLLEDISSAG